MKEAGSNSDQILNPLVNNSSQHADWLSMNPSGDFRSITLCWCESKLTIERTSDTKKLVFILLFFFFKQVTFYSCISWFTALLYI